MKYNEINRAVAVIPPQKMEDIMKKFFKALSEVVLLLLTGKSRQGVEDGICDYSGQGRNEYGD